MNHVNAAKSLRSIALCLILSVGAAFFEALSSESDIGVFLGKVGMGIILVSAVLQAIVIIPIRRETNGYESAFSVVTISAVLAIVTCIFSYGAGNSTFFAYAGNLCEYFTLLSGIVSSCMILLGTMQLLRKKKEKKMAEQAMKTVQSFIILTAVAVGLKIVSSMLGTNKDMVSAAIVIALAYFVLNVIGYVKIICFLWKAAAECKM